MEHVYHIIHMPTGAWKCRLQNKDEVLFTSPTREEAEEIAIELARHKEHGRVLVFEQENGTPRERLFARQA